MSDLPKDFTLERKENEDQDNYTYRLAGWAESWLKDDMKPEDVPEGVPRYIVEAQLKVKAMSDDQLYETHDSALYSDEYNEDSMCGVWCRLWEALSRQELYYNRSKTKEQS